MNYFLTLALAVMLTACGGGSDPIIKEAQGSTYTTPLPINLFGMSIVKPSTALDAYQGGFSVVRDTTGMEGGTHGHVNTANFTKTTAGANVLQFEWATLSILDNFATKGENVALYAQANKRGVGHTFGAVSEVNDTVGQGAAVGHEIDLFTTGPDNGQRLGLDIVVGDAKAMRGMGRSEVAQGTTGVRIGVSRDTPWATLGTGIEVSGVIGSAFKVVNAAGVVVFEIKPNGDVYKNGIKVL